MNLANYTSPQGCVLPSGNGVTHILAVLGNSISVADKLFNVCDTKITGYDTKVHQKLKGSLKLSIQAKLITLVT